MPTPGHRLQVLGMSNTVVRDANDAEDPSIEAGGCWGGDTQANLGFTYIQVGSTGCGTNREDQDQGVSFAKVEWTIQGVRDINPLKIKKKIKTTSK